MAKAKKTNEEVINFINVAGVYLEVTEEDNKLKYAINKIFKSLKKVIDDYNEKLEDLRIDHCSTDEDGNIKYVHNTVSGKMDGYSFTKENRKKLNKDIANLKTELVDIEPYYCKDLPEGLSENIVEIFTGFVIEEKQ